MSSRLYEIRPRKDQVIQDVVPPELWSERKKSQILPVHHQFRATYYRLADEVHDWFVSMGRTYRLKYDWDEEPYVVVTIKSRRTAMLYKLTWHGR